MRIDNWLVSKTWGEPKKTTGFFFCCGFCEADTREVAVAQKKRRSANEAFVIILFSLSVCAAPTTFDAPPATILSST